jgi:hypothetical protein
MNADSSSGNPTKKRASLSGCAVSVFHLLGMFWLTELALLLVGLYGLYAGWTTPRQWSDGLFYAAIAQIVVAGVWMYSMRGDAVDASWMRYVDHGDITETYKLLGIDTLRRMKFGVRAFLGGILTLLIAALVLRV